MIEIPEEWPHTEFNADGRWTTERGWKQE